MEKDITREAEIFAWADEFARVARKERTFCASCARNVRPGVIEEGDGRERDGRG